MANHHYEKWILKMPIGFLLISGGIYFMYYSLTHLATKENTEILGLISALSVGVGCLFISSATIHKMKSDLIKKQKARQQES